VSVLISTCVAAQPAHRDRRGRRRTSPSRRRSTRHRADPHGRSRPPQPGHPSSPATSARSTSSSSVPTIFNSASGHQEGPSRHVQVRSGRVLARTGRVHADARREQGQPEGRPHSVSTLDVATTAARVQPPWRSTLAPSKEAFDTPLSPPPLDDEPGPAIGLSGDYPNGTSTRWSGPACRTQHATDCRSRVSYPPAAEGRTPAGHADAHEATRSERSPHDVRMLPKLISWVR